MSNFLGIALAAMSNGNDEIRIRSLFCEHDVFWDTRRVEEGWSQGKTFRTILHPSRVVPSKHPCFEEKICVSLGGQLTTKMGSLPEIYLMVTFLTSFPDDSLAVLRTQKMYISLSCLAYRNVLCKLSRPLEICWFRVEVGICTVFRKKLPCKNTLGNPCKSQMLHEYVHLA